MCERLHGSSVGLELIKSAWAFWGSLAEIPQTLQNTVKRLP